MKFKAFPTSGGWELGACLDWSSTILSFSDVFQTNYNGVKVYILLPRWMECRHDLAMRILSVCLSVKRVSRNTYY